VSSAVFILCRSLALGRPFGRVLSDAEVTGWMTHPSANREGGIVEQTSAMSHAARVQVLMTWRCLFPGVSLLLPMWAFAQDTGSTVPILQGQTGVTLPSFSSAAGQQTPFLGSVPGWHTPGGEHRTQSWPQRGIIRHAGR